MWSKRQSKMLCGWLIMMVASECEIAGTAGWAPGLVGHSRLALLLALWLCLLCPCIQSAGCEVHVILKSTGSVVMGFPEAAPKLPWCMSR